MATYDAMLVDAKLAIKDDSKSLGSFSNTSVTATAQQFYDFGKAVNSVQDSELSKVIRTETYRMIRS